MKIIIVGNSGSGKTWLAKRLSTLYISPVVHLDDLFWEPGGFDKKRSSEEIGLLIRKSKDRASWIVEGVFGELVSCFFDEAELFLWLDIEWTTCQKRLKKRSPESEIHLGREQSKEGLKKLIDWASRYYDRKDLRSYSGHRTLLESFPGKKAHLRSETEVNNYVANF